MQTEIKLPTVNLTGRHDHETFDSQRMGAQSGCPVERGAPHKIGYVFGKLSVEHVDAMHNLVRVSEFVRQVRTRFLDDSIQRP